MLGWMDLSEVPIQALTLLESVQLSWLPSVGGRRELALVLRAHHHLSWFMRHKCPEIAPWLDQLQAEFAAEPFPAGAELRRHELAVLAKLEDWLIYVIDPAVYDRLSFNRWADQELLGLADWQGKVVLDVGAGTGSQTFRIAPLAQTVYCVEPVGNLRRFIRQQARERGMKNVFAVDGLLTSIPFPDRFADILVSGHAFGDAMPAELAEMLRVSKPGGMIILCPASPDRDTPIHNWLVQQGFDWGRFEEPGPSPGAGWMRKYWLEKPTD